MIIIATSLKQSKQRPKGFSQNGVNKANNIQKLVEYLLGTLQNSFGANRMNSSWSIVYIIKISCFWSRNFKVDYTVASIGFMHCDAQVLHSCKHSILNTIQIYLMHPFICRKTYYKHNVIERIHSSVVEIIKSTFKIAFACKSKLINMKNLLHNHNKELFTRIASNVTYLNLLLFTVR